MGNSRDTVNLLVTALVAGVPRPAAMEHPSKAWAATRQGLPATAPRSKAWAVTGRLMVDSVTAHHRPVTDRRLPVDTVAKATAHRLLDMASRLRAMAVKAMVRPRQATERPAATVVTAAPVMARHLRAMDRVTAVLMRATRDPVRACPAR